MGHFSLAVRIYGLVAAWDDIRTSEWVDTLLALEEDERGRRSLERRLRNARIGSFKSISDFDWSWPKTIDRTAMEELLRLDFLDEGANVVLIGPNGVGKTTIAQNLAHQAILRGDTVRFTTASDLLHELASCDLPSLLAQRIRRFVRPRLLVIDEVGYLSYSSRHGDLLFDVLNRRNLEKSTVVTTNKPFSEWNEVFPNSSCVVALIDRLIHKCEVQAIEGDSYRRKEAEEHRAAKDARRRKASRKRRIDAALAALQRSHLVDQRPWRPGHVDGVWQLLPLDGCDDRTSPRRGAVAPAPLRDLLRHLGHGDD